MLHFFPHYAKDMSDSPVAAELLRLGVEHRFFGDIISLRYNSALGLAFGVYRRLTAFALRSVVRSLLLSRPRPVAAIVGSDIEAIVFGIVRRVLRRRTLIVFETFIVTRRSSQLAEALRWHYYNAILKLVDVAVCHAQAEIAYYRQLFPRARCRFAFVPYGTTVNGRTDYMAAYAQSQRQDGAIVTAGRSGRDYLTLAQAIRGLPCRLDIICDVAGPVAGLDAHAQINIRRNCFDRAYMEALAHALFVVVPLAVDDISAGQMVLLQAWAVGKAVIITRTASTAEYATDGEDALLVDRGDVEQLRTAIERLLEDAPFRERLGRNAAARFEAEHSTEAYTRKLVAVVSDAQAAMKVAPV